MVQFRHCPWSMNTQRFQSENNYAPLQPYYNSNIPEYNPYFLDPSMNQFNPYYEQLQQGAFIDLKDYGPEPYSVNITEATLQNNHFRTALWTGDHLQLTLMSINVGEDIGLEVHPELDQFIRIEQGEGLVMMGDSQYNLDFQRMVYDDFIFIIPAGKWHNLVNTGNMPLKLYSIYAPPQHPHGTVHETKEIAEAAEHEHWQ